MSDMSAPVKTIADAITLRNADQAAFIGSLIAATGTTLQYVRGNGALATFPSLEPLNILGVSTGVRRREFDLVKTSVNCNALNTDVAAWTGLPSRWRLEGLYCFVPAGQPSLLTVAKIALYTGPGATGTNLLASVLIATDAGLINDFSITAGVSKAIQTASACYLRCTVAAGLTATANFALILQDLTDN